MDYQSQSITERLDLENYNYRLTSDPVDCMDYFLLKHKGFNYYVVDLKVADFDRIGEIISGCEAAEKDTWNAQEDFFKYIQKSDFLVYAEKDGQIVGFNLISLLIVNDYCIYTIDEAMVMKKFQGNKIARNVVLLAIRWFMKKIMLEKKVKRVTFVSISSNPKVVNNYFNSKYVTRLFDNSFYPSRLLVDIHNDYCRKHSFALVHEDYPFCIRNLFPGSHKFSSNARKNQFHDEVKDRMPPEFDHIKRGDAFAFMVSGPIIMFNIVSFLVEQLVFGFKIWFNRDLGFFRRKKTMEEHGKLRRISFINDRIIERRIGDRREDKFEKGHGSLIDRRLGDRRTAQTWSLDILDEEDKSLNIA